MMTPLKKLKNRRIRSRRHRPNGCFAEGLKYDETAEQPLDNLPAMQSPNQDRVGIMVKALRRWLETNELPAIVAGVVGALVMLSLLLVLGGYLIVAR
jgi:hypothetical protein